ncbi:MarR family transcriptional regulator [Ferrimonas balearica]|nr:MarR family transcriptional regulator [Ferrimonas balearica]
MTPHQPDPHHILKSIARLSRALRKVYDTRARDYGLSLARLEALLIISANEGLTQTDLADRLQIEAPTLNRTLDGLARDGFVERRPDPEDRRLRRVVLTDHARAEADALFRFSETLRAELLAGIPTEELDAAEDTISRIFANLERLSLADEAPDEQP